MSLLGKTQRIRKYAVPAFLVAVVAQAIYERWLHRKAVAHVRRDRKRGNQSVLNEHYKKAIHDAVCQSDGKDAYTGEPLDWHLISKYDNEASAKGRRVYKASFARLPTVDHVGDGTGAANFKICGWRTNDAKNDLALEEFIELCRKVLAHHKV